MSDESDALYTMDTTTGIRGPVSDDKPMATVYVNGVPTPVGATTSTAHVFSPLTTIPLANGKYLIPASQATPSPLTETGVRRIVAEELAKVRASLVHDVLYELSQRMRLKGVAP